MTGLVMPSLEELRDLEVLLRAHHPLIVIETVEDERAETLLAYVADRMRLAHLSFAAHRGLLREGAVGGPIVGAEKLSGALAHLARAPEEAIVHVQGAAADLAEPAIVAQLKELHRAFRPLRGGLVFTGPEIALPKDLEPLFTHYELPVPSERAYHQFVTQVLRDLKKRMQVSVELSSEDVARLLSHLRGLTFFEVRKIVTKAVVEDGRLGPEDIEHVLEAKKQIVKRSGVLDYFPVEQSMDDVAGLLELKAWLRKRKAVFANPDKAQKFGLTPPKGLLLVGVQGCGKSLCAKAVASEWQLPLLRLDPSNLYQKYYGETEKSLKRAIKTAEALAPVVLWVDEIEKALGVGTGEDSGTSSRVLGTFLAWLQEKKHSVFVLATANDISALPPELVRKGRFDEIFFVDLPDAGVRKSIFELHLRRRGKKVDALDLDALAAASDGFSGAEIEQVVLSALYAVFSNDVELSTDTLLAEVKATRPLSVTMSEKVERLREWARDRAVPAG